MNVIVLIAASVLVYFLSTEQENGHQANSGNGSDGPHRGGGHQPGGIPQEDRERVIETEVTATVPVPEPTNKKE